MPNENILIKVTPPETRVALVSNGVLKEVCIERNLSKGIVGNIFIGKVVRVLPGMQSAFIDIGLEKTGFLHVADVHQAKQAHNEDVLIPLEKILFAGQYILVQVLKDAIGTKGARLTTYISLVGRNLVYLPTEKNNIGISQKITDAQERDLLREKLEQVLLPQNIDGGFILRTASHDANVDDFSQDITYLTKTWEKIYNIPKLKLGLVHKELALSFKICRDTKSIDAIYIDDKNSYEELKEFLGIYMPYMQNTVHLHQSPQDIFSLYNVEQELQQSLHRRVELKSGGFLIIDQTEAMVTIDVNTGAYIGKTSFADTILKINLEASEEIAHQLRLRNLGGIVIIDFIDMHQEGHHEIVLNSLKQALSYDRAKTYVHGFTALGLVEMTRKRTRDSISHTLCSSCETCGGTGLVKTLQTVCYDILHEISRQAQQFKPTAFKIVAHPNIIQRFLQEDRIYLKETSTIIDKEIFLQSQNFIKPDMYDIILIN
jgi:ribonuclease G